MKNEMKTQVEVPEVVEDTTLPAISNQGNNLSFADNSLAEYVQFANEMHKNVERTVGQIQSLQQLAIANALALGYTLTYIKENCPRGTWLKLFKGGQGKAKANSPHVVNFDFSDMTGRRFMAVYKNMEERALALGGEDRRGQLMLQLQHSGATASGIIAVDDLTDAKTLAQLYIDLNILPKRKPAAKDKVPAAMQQAQKENLKRTEEDAMRAAAQIVTIANEYVERDAPMCSKTFNGEIAAQLKEIAARLAKTGIPTA